MMERTIDGFRGFLDCLENPQEKGVIYGIGAWKVGEIKDTPYMQEAYEMGKWCKRSLWVNISRII